MTIVVDASVTMTWCFEDEGTDATEAVLQQVGRTGAVVPPLWRLEVANAFQNGLRRKRIDARFRADSLDDLMALSIFIDPDCDHYVWTRTLDFSDRYRLTIYDASYLELADRHNLPLATLDRQLRVAAAACGLTVLGQ